MPQATPRTHFAAIIALMLASLLTTAPTVHAAAKRQQIGQASGSLGSATIDGQRLGIGAPVFEGSRIVTGDNDSASVLLNSKVVLKFDANTAAVVSEAKGTHVQLEQGNVEVFVARRLPGAGAVALSDPDATIEALGTVFIAGYSPADRGGWYATVESTRPRGVSVRGNADPGATDLPPGQFVRLQAGKLMNPPAGTDPGELKQHLGTIGNLDKALGKHAGAVSRQKAAVTEFVRVQRSINGTAFNQTLQNALASHTGNDARTDAIQYQSVTTLVSHGVITSSGGSTSGGGGGAGGVSSGGFSDISVTLGSGGVLTFRLFDAGTPDGDQVALRVISNGSTVLNVPSITLTNTGTQFSPKVSAGNVAISLTALNDGSIPPNTGGVTLQNVTAGHAQQTYSVNTGQVATLQVKTH
ncbi:MAG TPA: FecR domain-containing protein [Tepidisphaeraceae bacterium]|nr:FecR domain-containing protein [Tepidisphaeraceae bacterium]